MHKNLVTVTTQNKKTPYYKNYMLQKFRHLRRRFFKVIRYDFNRLRKGKNPPNRQKFRRLRRCYKTLDSFESPRLGTPPNHYFMISDHPPSPLSLELFSLQGGANKKCGSVSTPLVGWQIFGIQNLIFLLQFLSVRRENTRTRKLDFFKNQVLKAKSSLVLGCLVDWMAPIRCIVVKKAPPPFRYLGLEPAAGEKMLYGILSDFML